MVCADEILSVAQDTLKKSLYKIAANFNINNLDELYFDDYDAKGLFFWLDGVSYING